MTEICTPGYALQPDGECSICPLGTYLNYPRTMRQCTPCPNNLTTDGEGSDDVTLCKNSEYFNQFFNNCTFSRLF